MKSSSSMPGSNRGAVGKRKTLPASPLHAPLILDWRLDGRRRMIAACDDGSPHE